MEQRVIDEIIALIGEEKVRVSEPMKEHTCFGIGGPADLFVRPGSEEEIAKILQYCHNKNIPWFVMGNGTNLLVRDGGMRCVVIQIADNLADHRIDGEVVEVQAGMLLSRLSKRIMEQELTGFEFASGIPGTIGGALTMNAGAYGGEFKDIVKTVRIMDAQGNVTTKTNEEMEFAYRTSILKGQPAIALGCTLQLTKGKFEEIKAVQDELTHKRVTKQPVAAKSAGSTFQRPPGYFAGKLIDDCGFRGFRHGGAMVSELHTGFVINDNNATAKDVLELLQIIKDKVSDTFHVSLHEEVRIVGEDQ